MRQTFRHDARELTIHINESDFFEQTDFRRYVCRLISRQSIYRIRTPIGIKRLNICFNLGVFTESTLSSLKTLINVLKPTLSRVEIETCFSSMQYNYVSLVLLASVRLLYLGHMREVDSRYRTRGEVGDADSRSSHRNQHIFDGQTLFRRIWKSRCRFFKQLWVVSVSLVPNQLDRQVEEGAIAQGYPTRDQRTEGAG